MWFRFLYFERIIMGVKRSTEEQGIVFVGNDLVGFQDFFVSFFLLSVVISVFVHSG